MCSMNAIISGVANMDVDERQQCEVSRIISHMCNDQGEFRFTIRFTDRTTETVNDTDCACEVRIQEYLEARAPNVRTAYLFCRVSTQRQSGPTHISHAVQERTLRNVARRVRLEHGEVLRIKVIKISASAYSGIPAHLQEISEVARPRDMVLVYRADRLSRNIELYMHLLSVMHNRGVLLYAADRDLWYHTNRLDFLTLILEANKESEKMSQNARAVLIARRARGDVIGNAPYGYRNVRLTNPDGTTRRIERVFNDDEMRLIHRIIRMRGTSSYIAGILNAQGLTKRGKSWTESSVWSIVRAHQD
jgi:DNA invertase Pin-like site-specific DNA recombinase